MIKIKHAHNTQRAIWILLVFSLLLTAVFVSGCGTDPEAKTYRVGVLSGLNFVANSVDGFKEGMAELGYVEGENIVYDVQSTDFDMDAYKRILNQFVADKVDMIFVFPTEATIEAKAITEGTGIPVIFTFALIDGFGVVDSIREPGGNITGVRYPGADVALRRFEILRELVPGATRILMPYQRGYPIVQPQLDVLYPTAEAAGVTLIEAPADNAAELATILQEHSDIDALLLLVEPLVVAPDAFAAVSAYAAEQQIPFGGVYVPGVEYRSLFGVNVDSFASAKQAAPLADKIFQGIETGTVPVATAEMFVEIDYKMAQELGVAVPESLLVLADEVYR